MADVTPTAADLVARVLASLKIGTDPAENGAWPIHVMAEPNEPNDVITIVDTEGVLQGRLQVTGAQVEKPGILIRIRSKSPTPRKTSEIRNALDKTIRRNSINVSGVSYMLHSVKRTSNVISIGKDPLSGLNLFTINALVTLS